MELAVEIADALEIAGRAAQGLVVLIFSELAQLSDTGRGHASCSACSAIRFQQSPQLEYIVAIFVGPLGDNGALVRDELEQSFCMQLAQCLAHRRAAHPCSRGNFLFGDAGGSWIDASHDALTHGLV